MDIINSMILITIAISGTVFGSFFTLAVHRIPKKQDITHERSYCPKCNHKLQFLDLIPVFSYLFLGGKCRYCKEKIRPRYFILEVLSGLIFLLLGLTYSITIQSSLMEYVHFGILILFLCCIFITAGIDKEYYKIPNGVMLYGLGIGVLKLVVSRPSTVELYYLVMGMLLLPLFLLITNWICQKVLKKQNIPFGGGDIKYLAVLGLFLGFGKQVIALVISVFVLFFSWLLEKIQKRETKEIAFGFYLSIGATIVIVLAPFLDEIVDVINMMICF